MPEDNYNDFENPSAFQRFFEEEFSEEEESIADNDQVTCEMIHPLLTEWLNSLEEPSETNLWENRLDPLQLQLRACLAEEIVMRVIRSHGSFPAIQHLDDNHLVLLMVFPITLAMMALEMYRDNGYPQGFHLEDRNDGD